jgi:membrane-associated phospholipid phosphatase
MPGYRLVDYLTQGYIALAAVLILLFHGDALPQWPFYVAGHAAVIVVIYVLIRRSEKRPNRFLSLLRSFYPMILYGLLYNETHVLDNLFYSGYLDGYFIDLDQRLFGAQLSRTLMERFPYVWVSEVFYLFYFSYYAMVLIVGLALYVRDKRQFFQYITVVSFVFYACYVTYAFLPVLGPDSANEGFALKGQTASVSPRPVPEAIRSGPFYWIVWEIYDVSERGGGAAFPSSHVAVALTTLWFTWSYLKKARLIHMVAVVMLCLSTVYCGFHYAVDVLGGLAAAAVLAPVGVAIHRKWDQPLPAISQAERAVC